MALLVFSFTNAQESGTISGALSDKETNNSPLPFANVIIKGTSKGTTTDFDGLYTLDNLDPGTYSVEFSFVGYEVKTIDNVVVKSGEITKVNAILGASAAALDEVVITVDTNREKESALLVEQKKAIEIKQAIGAQELARKGISTAAAAIAKITGVSKQEGSSDVYVRGLGDRYLNTTLNGLTMPSNDINKKNIDLGLFSADVIQNVSISKAYSSKFYADFSAGNLNVQSKEQKGKGFFTIDFGSSINNRAAGKDFIRSEGSGFGGYYTRYAHNPFAVILSHGVDPENAGSPINLNFGASTGKSFTFKNGSKLKVFATGSFQNDFEYRDGEARDFTVTLKKEFPNVEEFVYKTTTTGMFNAVYSIDDQNTLKYNSLYINSSESSIGYYGYEGNGFNRDAGSDGGFFQHSSKFKQDQIVVNQILGEHHYDQFDVDWGIGYNVVKANEPDRKFISLENYNLELDNDPSTNAEFYDNNTFDSQRYFQTIDDEEISSTINFAYTFHENLKVNLGYNGRYKQREFENIRYGYDVPPTLAVDDVTNFDTLFTVQNLNNGVYETVAFRSFTEGLSSTNNPGAPENTYKGYLRIAGTYLNAEYNISDDFLIVPGLRIENFKQRVTYDVINISIIDPGFREVNNTFVLPSLNLKYSLNDDTNLRFSVSKTVSVPELKEIIPYVYEDVTRRIAGNPELLNNPSFSEIYNADLKYEWFFGKNELLAATIFGKQINDPINLVTAADATGTQRYFRTGNQATAYGLELEAKKNVLLDADDEVVLSAGFNVALMKTEQDLKTVVNTLASTSFDRDSDELQGASNLLVNADLNYAPTFGNYKPKANLIFGYKSNSIYALGAGTLGNIVEQAYASLDFILKNNITDKFAITINAKNLLDPAVKYVRENSDQDIIISSYKRGIDLGVTLKYNF